MKNLFIYIYIFWLRSAGAPTPRQRAHKLPAEDAECQSALCRARENMWLRRRRDKLLCTQTENICDETAHHRRAVQSR